MAEVLSSLPGLATLVYAVSSMLSVGLSYTPPEIVGPLRNGPALIRALVANFVAVPILAYFAARLLMIDGPLAAGLLLVGTGAGAPFLIRLTASAGADLALSAALLALLLPATVLYMPLILPRLLPQADVSVIDIAMPLFLSTLLPFVLGMVIRARSPPRAERLEPFMTKTSKHSLVALIALTLLVNLPEILDVTVRAVLAALILVTGGFASGYVLGIGLSSNARDVLGLGTAQRNIAAATVVATKGLDSSRALVMVIVTALVGLAVLFPIATKLRQRREARAAARARGYTRRRRRFRPKTRSSLR